MKTAYLINTSRGPIKGWFNYALSMFMFKELASSHKLRFYKSCPQVSWEYQYIIIVWKLRHVHLLSKEYNAVDDHKFP